MSQTIVANLATRRIRTSHCQDRQRAGIMKSNINPDLLHLARDIATLKPDPQNARSHSKRNLDAIAASLQAYGQLKPIVACKGVVLAGNGTLEAALSLGWETIAVTEFKGAGIQKTGYALADNRTAELADWDFEKLSDQLNLFENQLELQNLWSPEEMAALQVVSEPLEPGQTPAQRLDVFANNAIKQIVIYLEDAQYKDIIIRFRKIMEKCNLESSTEVVIHLLNEYENRIVVDEAPIESN